jgi:hypothetical protein
LGFDTHNPLRRETFVYPLTPLPRQRVPYRAHGGRRALPKRQPHTFIVRDPARSASRQATELMRDFVLESARHRRRSRRR